MQQEIQNISQKNSGVITLAYGIPKYVEKLLVLAYKLLPVLQLPEKRCIRANINLATRYLQFFSNLLPNKIYNRL